MADECSTTLKWHGTMEIGLRLSNLIPDGFEYELTEEDGFAVLMVNISANDLETLRKSVDDLLTLFSDQDQ